MTRVCMLVHQDYYRDDRVWRYTEALALAGVQVDVLCLPGSSAPLRGLPPGVEVFSIPLRRTGQRPAAYALEYGLALVLFTILLLRRYLRRRYAVIHVHNMPDFLIFAAWLPRLLGTKLILDIHDPMPEFYQSKYQCSADARLVRLMRLQERLSAALAHAVIAANATFKANLVARGIPERKITVVENVVDPQMFDRQRYYAARERPRERFTLIYPGTIAPRYGLDIPIRALPELIKHIPNIRLLLIGSHGRYSEELSKLAAQLGVAAYVDFQPAIPVHEVPGAMADADVGIYPALPDPHMSIAVPTKVLEYAVMGLPIVAARLPVLEVRFPDTAVQFFSPGSIEQFTDCVLELFEQPERRAQLVANADSAFVARHRWSDERRLYFKVLNRLLRPGAWLADDLEERAATEAV